MGGEKSAPAGKLIFVDFLAVAQPAHQTRIDVEGGTAGQGEPVDLLGSVEPAKNGPIEGFDGSASGLDRHDVPDRAQQEEVGCQMVRRCQDRSGPHERPRAVGKRADDRPSRWVVVGVAARRGGGRIAYRRGGTGERKGARQERVAALLAVQSPAAAGEYVAAEALIQVKVTDQLAQVGVGDGTQDLAGALAEHQRIEIFDQRRRADRRQPDRPHRRPYLGHVERLPCAWQELVDEIGRGVVFRPLLEFADNKARRQRRRLSGG